jgi:hypothetical protein
MKPTINFGLTDSLVDSVKKAVEEAAAKKQEIESTKKDKIDLKPTMKQESVNEETQIDEKLIGKQKNIDKNKNGKLDAQDFKLLKKEEMELEERNKENATARKMMDASRGAKFKAQPGTSAPDPEPQHKTPQAHNKAIGRAIRKMSESALKKMREIAEKVGAIDNYKDKMAAKKEAEKDDLTKDYKSPKPAAKRVVQGTSYGGSNQKPDAENDNEDDSPKKAVTKGSFKRRFNTKAYK